MLPGHEEIFIQRIPPSLFGFETIRTVENRPLIYRAWVFDEIELSRRIVHFDVDEV